MTYPVFPSLPGQGIGLTRAPVWRTGIQSALSGKEVPISYMSYPLYQWALDLNALRSYAGNAELAQMIGFINSVAGMGGRFLFQDPEDNAVTNQSFGVGNGSTTLFQLVRTYGGYSEPVQSPYVGTIYSNGTVVTQGYGAGQCQINTTNGTVNFVNAPASAAALTWSGSFYFLCRMLQDNQKFTQEFINAWSTKTLGFQSVKL